MSYIKTSDKEFIDIWKKYKSGSKVAKALNLEYTGVMRRRRRIEAKYGMELGVANVSLLVPEKPEKFNLGVLNGIVIVFSDAHFWGERSTAFQGLLWAISELKPNAVIANGDIFDGAKISRHARIGWDKTPTVLEELRACKDAMEEIEDVAKKARHNVKLIWPLGNHDARFETFLAANAPQYENVGGFSLKDHFPSWKNCWSVWINEDTIVKHRFKGGIHATHNNTLTSGVSIVTGHLHSLKVNPYSDYNGTRYGVDTGCIAETFGEQFRNYTEEGPVNWRSGFAVLSFVNGKLLMPELVQRYDKSKIEFRGKVIDVSEY